MPLYRRLPKRGFNSISKEKIAMLNLEVIQLLIDKNKLDAGTKINLNLLKKEKILNKSYSKIKVLGNGELKSKIDIEVDYSSSSAKNKIEKVGGSIIIKAKK